MRQELKKKEEKKPQASKSSDKSTSFRADPVKVVRKYMPFLCIWICRICSIVIAYAYDGYGGFVVLTWLLLSFVMNMEKFALHTQIIYQWFFILAFLYEYFLNI